MKKPSPEEDQVCAVCLDDLIGGHDPKIGALDCRHVFHVCCIAKWLLNNNICPLCRAVALSPP
ncbi:probable E3 ubiquitin-protein ligase hip1 [Phtheirospermum japonicum]|nr:probable E3 ubiquitin-protein ligase hip1 [Phtheirospermum japonicum]